LDLNKSSEDYKNIMILKHRGVSVGYANQKTCSGASEKIDIGSYAWVDYNNDGIRQQIEERGSLGFVLNLWQDTNGDGKADKKLASTTTSYRGYYHFTKLDKTKSYFIEIELPEGYSLAQKHSGSNPLVDSDFNVDSRFTDKLVFPDSDFVEGLAGAAILKAATPEAKQAAIGDWVWEDDNKDGRRTNWERGIKGIKVNLYLDVNKDAKPDYAEPFKSMITGYRGFYIFKHLDPDINYIVEVIPRPTLSFAKNYNSDPNSTNNTDSDINPETGRSFSIDVKEGENHLWIDAAIIYPETANCKDPVSIPDPVLKEALEDSLGTISCAGLITLTHFDYSGQFDSVPDIKDLSGLEYARNLELLRLDHNSISDISELKYLPKLQTLALDHNKIKDVSALSTLGELRYLNLQSNLLENIDSLVNLTKLSDLNISYNQITNIDALANLSNLSRLQLYENKIKNISKTLNLPKLTQLTFGHNDIVDISGISGLTGLTRLGLHNNKITNIEAVKTLPQLKQVYLSDNPGLKDLSPLKNLPGLTLLYLDNVQPTDISFLSKTNQLETIAMQNSGLSDISVFEQLTELHLVMIQKNMITDISPIVRIEGIDGGIVRISENCLDISGGQDLADINNLKSRGVTVNYTPQKNCN